MKGSWELVAGGEQMLALPQKALFWPNQSTLFVADVHLGKDATMQAAGIPIPLGPTNSSLQNLTDLLLQVQPKRLVLLGDLWHAKAGRTADLVADFVAWRQLHCEIEMLLVEGNHDAKAGPLPAEIGVSEVKEPHEMGPFSLCHYPETVARGYVLSGHIHPGVVLHGKGRQSMRLPCFWFGKRVAVLPAFGEFTGCGRVSPCEGDQVLLIAEGSVFPAQIST